MFFIHEGLLLPALASLFSSSLITFAVAQNGGELALAAAKIYFTDLSTFGPGRVFAGESDSVSDCISPVAGTYFAFLNECGYQQDLDNDFTQFFNSGCRSSCATGDTICLCSCDLALAGRLIGSSQKFVQCHIDAPGRAGCPGTNSYEIPSPPSQVYTCDDSGQTTTSAPFTSTSTSISTSSPRPSATCRYQYLPQFCQVPETERCLFNGKKLVRGPAPTFNGCGTLANSLGFEAIRVALDTFAGDFQDSCNNHDICFGSCSFGDDSLFNTCNSNFLAQMLLACKANYPTTGGSIGGSIVRSARGAICVAQANFVYSTVQLGGCEAYGDAQRSGCRCVDCDDTPMEANTISVLNPVVNSATAFCGIAPDIAADWTNFLVDFALAIASATDPAIASALRLFGSQIGYTSAQPSPQIQALVQSCHGSSRRRSHIRLSIRQAGSRLSDYFTSLSLDANTIYGCSQEIDNSACDTANALVAIARIARALDDYGIGVATPATPSSSASDGFIPSSTTIFSIPLSTPSNPTANASSAVAISGSVTLSLSAGSSTLSTALGTTSNVSLSSTAVATSNRTSPATSPYGLTLNGSNMSVTASRSLPVDSISMSTTASSTTLGVTGPSSANCTLVKVYGDSPDSPDSADGQPEIPEIPDYPVSTPVSYMMRV